MNIIPLLTAAALAVTAHAEPPCPAGQTDLVVIGDSQTGASWASSYFGNFLQKCLKEHPLYGSSFAVYGRGGTQPVHWLSNPGLDKIATVQRDPANNHRNIGTLAEVPLCKKRLPDMLRAHAPKKFVLFFGDNLLGASEEAIASQFDRAVTALAEGGVAKGDCYVVTPTYEMSVLQKRNVPAKDLANTLKVIAAARKGTADRCVFVDGVELMRNSPLTGADGLLARVQTGGKADCLGAAGNDNIHVCGEAARELAERVCALLR